MSAKSVRLKLVAPGRYSGSPSFSRTDFADTMSAGYLPDGSLWRWRSMHDTEPRLWEVRGRMLYEAGGIRRVTFNATFDGD